MRLVILLSVALLLTGLAAGQTTQAIVIVGNGNASTYSVYSMPLVTTPSVSLQTVLPAPVGASNATLGNSAGARNATLSMVNANPANVYTQPVWYAPQSPSLVIESNGGTTPQMTTRAADYYGAGSFEGQGAARMVAASGPAKKASRTYTNEDVDRFNQNTGNVKYDGKTEKVN